jgi:hypothetical protein
VILPMSASQVARITGVSHQCLDPPAFCSLSYLTLLHLAINFSFYFFLCCWGSNPGPYAC